ncbi:hypothetical protein BJ322DRAFT_1106310 [Thelephora terrestris]|uniref:Transmembrane protein n=1 Tax=Thelephora terrestris TaxID=56493 RepID=A0A9P6L9S7_9AGAM|nr:hypothetical protein BJ322DRAFT_1106310 [Thelephora terrestris]
MSHDDPQSQHMGADPLTFTAADTQPTTSTLGTADGNGPFVPGNTPPLVFAFIALGFTVFGLVIAIIYKRCRPLPNSLNPHYQRSAPVGRLSHKPKFWDVWTPLNQHVPDEETSRDVSDWDTFVPLSASLVYPYSPPSHLFAPPQYVQGHVLPPGSLESPERRLFFRHPPADTSLHVSVMITMPRRPQEQDAMQNRNEYHVGVTEVKWTG